MIVPNYYILIPFIALFIEVFTFTYVLAQGSKSGINVTYLFFSGFITIWVFQNIIPAVLPLPDPYIVPLFKMVCFAWQSLGLLFTIFTYNLLKKKIDFMIYIIAIIAVISIIVTITTDLAIAGLDITPLQRHFKEGPLLMPVIILTAFIPFGYSFILLLKRMRIETEKILKKQILFVVIGTSLAFVFDIYFGVVSPYILNIKDAFRTGGAPAVVHSIFIFIAITRYKFLKIGIQEAASDLFSNVRDGIAITDNEGKIIQMNKAMKKGLSKDKFKAFQLDKIIDLSDYINDYSFDKNYENHEISYILNSKSVNLLISQTTISESNIPIGKLLIMRDITNRKKAQEILEKQKEIIEQKNKEITDSIKYAQYIQKAVLPSEETFKNLFEQYFILFKPKDIVSGDFYWAYHTNDKVIWTVADCTGHGVPGAFMSMMGNTLLNEIVIEEKITSANKILDELRKHIVKTMAKKELSTKMRDGMDMALCVWHKQTNKLEFAGAFNPLYIIRKGIGNSEICRNGQVFCFSEDLGAIKPDKQPIGYDETMNKPFKNHEIQLKEGDCLYQFSDGYPDQHGGGNNIKFSNKRFRELLISVQDRSMQEQGEILNNTIEKWRGNGEQTDDICVIGVKI